MCPGRIRSLGKDSQGMAWFPLFCLGPSLVAQDTYVVLTRWLSFSDYVLYVVGWIAGWLSYASLTLGCSFITTKGARVGSGSAHLIYLSIYPSLTYFSPRLLFSFCSQRSLTRDAGDDPKQPEWVRRVPPNHLSCVLLLLLLLLLVPMLFINRLFCTCWGVYRCCCCCFETGQTKLVVGGPLADLRSSFE